MAHKLTHRLLPHPLLTLLLTVVWCLLQNHLSLGTVVMGLILGLLIPGVTAPYWPSRPTMSRPHKLIGYMVLVFWDIVVANIVVARLVLFVPNDKLKSCWITVPLDLKRPESIAMLAGTITLTPGTVSSDLSDKGHALLIHALHAPDPDAVRDEIKQRYERRLKEIFE